MNEYLAAYLMKERFRELRELAARQALLRAARPPRVPLRVVVGLALIRAGRLLARRAPALAGHPRGRASSWASR
jgi:hypothetical protein